MWIFPNVSHVLILIEDQLHSNFEVLKKAVFKFWESKPGTQYFQQNKNSHIFAETLTFGLWPNVKSVTSMER